MRTEKRQMDNEILNKIFDIPIFWRTFIVFFILWVFYVLFSRMIFKVISLIPKSIKFIWLLIYQLLNNLIHVIHKAGGKKFISLDQTITDFFGTIYSLISKLQIFIESAYIRKIPLYDKNGKQLLYNNGTLQYQNQPKKPFIGLSIILSIILVVWINIPIWLHIEKNANFITYAYHKYIDIERNFWELIVSNK